MDRRTFLASAGIGGVASTPVVAQNYSDYSKDPRPDVPEGTLTAGSMDGPIFSGSPLVSGPSPDAITILQPVQRQVTGHLEYAIADGPWNRVDGGEAGLLPLSEFVLKFRLPPLPLGTIIRYRTVAHTIGWVKVKQFYHGELRSGKAQISTEQSFRTLNPKAETTTFAVWNDTHENEETLRSLHQTTSILQPDFLLWNGDQSNDVHFEKDMAKQFIHPAGLTIADRWPLAFVRGNHDMRGPACRLLPQFTGTPNDRFYYGFRSGPLAALVMDTGDDAPDADPFYHGLVAYEKMQQEQAEWLSTISQETWFKEAPHKVMFCHIPLWFEHPKLPNSRFKGHVVRKLWEPLLVKAGVSVVISGHTHDHIWMKKKPGQPIAQLIGGAPQPRFATFIKGFATNKELQLTMTKLDGTVISDVTLPA